VTRGVDFILDLNRVALPLSAAGIFGAERPLEVEIGVGKGAFLLEWASAHPELGVVGVERARTYVRLAATRAARRGLANIRLLHSTAEDLLFRCLADASIAAVHVYFPDPWPKKRHHKRRFFTAANVARLAEVMQPSGMLRVKTDHVGYAAAIGEVLAAEARFEALALEPAFAGIPPTHFEIKYAREARAVNRFACRRR
jgi:tRNA (guanine-N7-)-methyltransferase